VGRAGTLGRLGLQHGHCCQHFEGTNRIPARRDRAGGRAGDEILRVAEGPERLTVAAVSALLYLPGPAKGEIERALRIPALSLGWKPSFEALLRQMAQPGSRTGNAGLASPEQMVTAAPVRPLKVVRIDRESRSVVSLVLEPADGRSSHRSFARAVCGVATSSQAGRASLTLRSAGHRSLSCHDQRRAVRNRQYLREHSCVPGRCWT
jgi:3-alpha domain